MQKHILFFMLGTVIFRNRTRNYLPLLSRIKALFSIRAPDRFKTGLTPNSLVPPLLNTPHTICRIQRKCGLKVMTLFLRALCLSCLMAGIQRNMVFFQLYRLGLLYEGSHIRNEVARTQRFTQTM